MMNVNEMDVRCSFSRINNESIGGIDDEKEWMILFMLLLLLLRFLLLRLLVLVLVVTGVTQIIVPMLAPKMCAAFYPIPAHSRDCII